MLVSDPNEIEKVFRNEGQLPSRAKIFTENVKWIHDKNMLPEGVFSATGAYWKRLRSAMSRQVVPRRIANYTPGLCNVANDLCNHFASQRNANGWINDIFDTMGKWSLKDVSYIVFDEQIDVFSGEDARGAILVKASQDLMTSAAMIAQAQNIRKLGRDMKRRYDQLSEACNKEH